MKTLLIFLLSIAIFGCMAPPTDSLNATMTKPIQSGKLLYEDSEVGVVFKITYNGVNFILKNKSSRPIRLIWDDVSFVKNGETKKSMHKGVKYIDAKKTQVPTMIPPDAILDELIFPSENARYVSGQYGGWVSMPIFTRYENGGMIGVLLPIEVGEAVRDYYFTFDVNLGRVKSRPSDSEGY